MSLFIVTLGFTLAISSKWAYSYFGLSSFEQIVYHIKVPLEGTNTQFIFGWMKKCLLPGLIFGLIFSWIPINIAKLILYFVVYMVFVKFIFFHMFLTNLRRRISLINTTLNLKSFHLKRR